jgi:hypothetical protein
MTRLLLSPSLVSGASARGAVSGAVLASLLAASATAAAQAPPLSEAIVIGSWTFRPSAELRVRGELRQNPVTYTSDGTAVLADAYNQTLPVNYGSVPIDTQWGLSERARLGMAVDRGPVTAVLVLQDSRVLGTLAGGFSEGVGGVGGLGGLGGLGGFAAGAYGLSMREAYLDVHSQSGRPMFLRVGRQRVVWGDGRLLGESDWGPTPRTLDAARFGFQLGDFDIELMGALLSPPFAQTIAGPAAGETNTVTWTGAQLYGANIRWHFLPLLNAELTALSRIIRVPGDAPAFASSVPITPGDTHVLSARLSGDRRGFRYSLEGAYELGRVASYRQNRDISAFAAAARASLETALPGHLTFGAQGSFASGDSGDAGEGTTQTRFDPILPDEFSNHSPMGLYAWSNLLEAGGDLSVTPLDELTISAGYRFAALADPKGRWTTGALTAVGASDANDSRVLGHEIDAGLTITPWEPIQLKAGYGLFLFGDKAKAILSGAGQTESMQHWGYLQALVHAP